MNSLEILVDSQLPPLPLIGGSGSGSGSGVRATAVAAWESVGSESPSGQLLPGGGEP